MMDLSSPYSKELQLACLAVQRAALLTRTLLESVDKGAIDKLDSTPVTLADFAAQALIIGALRRHFAGDDFVGEESADKLREDPALLDRVWQLLCSTRLEDPESEVLLASPATKEELIDLIDLGVKGKCERQGRAWVLDPVDGTATFMRGQQYAVCLALVENGQQKIGVLGCPNLNLESGIVSEDIVDRDGYGLMLFAVAGQGAFIRPMGRGALAPASPIPKIRDIKDLSELRFVDCAAAKSSDIEKHKQFAARVGAPWPPRADLWSAQMRYVAMAVGGCNALIKIPRNKEYRSNIWDHAGGMLIVEECGGKITDLDGNPVECCLGRTLAGAYGMVAAPEGAHARVLDAVQSFMKEMGLTTG
ncbi:myo-inositol-1-monophosphatase [Thermoascus aurantiacus ATCC 26904]